MTDMNFPEWLETEYTRMSAEYRAALNRKCIEFERITTMFPINQAHVNIAIQCLREVAIPSIGKYADATAEDKAYFQTALKPDWADMIQQAIKRCRDRLPG